MKLNWGFGILIFVLLFMAFILTLVYRCSLQKVDLVSEKYYEQELKYQQQVDKLNNTAAMNGKLSVAFNKVQDAITVMYPASTDLANLSGSINVFRPDDAALDFKIHAQAGQEYSQVIPVSKLKKGLWKVQVSWVSAGTAYYQEEKILIN